MSENFDENLTGIKWDIIDLLAKKPASPKQIATKLETTIANVSQHLRLLEAYGYLKKTRIDKGKGGRKKSDMRIKYELVKSQTIMTSLQPHLVSKQVIKETPLNLFLTRIMLLDIKEGEELLLKFYLDHQELFEKIDVLYYLKTEDNDVHLLVIAEELDDFRGKYNKLEILKKEKIGSIVFWSHTLDEFKDGLKRKEKYFLDQIKKSQLLFEKKPNLSSKLMEGTDE